ncbi:MAG: T9SS type A sorting domain-containing protein [Bacteroidales bacterium]|nr:T9SS type A sorting domain-containing protein [Bacteroidales bacterium]
MKKIVLILLLVTPILLNAQNYMNICSPGSTFYKKTNQSSVKAYKVTSFALPGNNDTIFYSFATIHDTGTVCLDTTRGSIFGRKIYRTADGMFYFFNKLNDTVYVNGKSNLNDSWRFCKLNSGSFLEATVTSIAPDSVMGVLDDVKLITLQAKRTDGTPIGNPWNGKFLKLSKHYGLSRTFDMVNLPYDTTYYTIAGKDHPVIGIQEFNWKNIYDYSIGDEFHYSGYNNSFIGQPNTSWKEINKVLQKTVYGNNDSVMYRMERCKSIVTTPGNTHTYTHDTVNVKYNFVTLGADSAIMRFPDQFKREFMYASQYDRYMNVYNNRQTKKIGEDKYRFINNCFELPLGSVITNNGYSIGLGQTEYFFNSSDNTEYHKLVYFKKGTETYGNPVGTECSPILTVDEQPASKTLQVRIVPNPFKNNAEIFVDGLNVKDPSQFILYNIIGQEVYRQPITSSPISFTKGQLPSGIYLYLVKTNSSSVSGKLVIE